MASNELSTLALPVTSPAEYLTQFGLSAWLYPMIKICLDRGGVSCLVYIKGLYVLMLVMDLTCHYDIVAVDGRSKTVTTEGHHLHHRVHDQL